MPTDGKLLGVMQPVGGGDPVPLYKDELVVGRRPTCDIQLNFENVSSKHCTLKLINHVWHVRDLGSTNGTMVNGLRISNEHGLMPDDELGVATHLFTIDYDPVSPVQTSKAVLEEEMQEKKRTKSLMELAGLETDSDRPGRRPSGGARAPARAPQSRGSEAASDIEFEDPLPDRYKDAADEKPVAPADDDFFKLIEEDVRGR